MGLDSVAPQGSASKGNRLWPCQTSLLRFPLPLPTSSVQPLDPRGGHASPRGQGRERADAGAMTNAPTPLGPGRPSATRTASTSDRGSASARTPTGATASAICNSAAVKCGRGRSAQGAR